MDFGFRIPIVKGILDCLRCIPDSNTQDSGFHQAKFPGFRNQDSITWTNSLVSDELKINGGKSSKLVVI